LSADEQMGGEQIGKRLAVFRGQPFEKTFVLQVFQRQSDFRQKEQADQEYLVQGIELDMQGKPGKPWRIKVVAAESDQWVFRETVRELLLEFKKAEGIVVVFGFIRR